MSYEIQKNDGRKEYFEDGELIAFINESGNLQAAHGKGDRKADLQAWIEESGDGTDEENPQVDFDTPEEVVEEGAASEEDVVLPANPEVNAPREGDTPEVDPEAKGPEAESTPDPSLEKKTIEAEIPTKEPRQSPGLGKLTPEYVRWAYNRQPDGEFEGLYGKTKEQFKKDHGGFLANCGAIQK